MDKIKPTREEILKTINKIIKEDFPCNWEFKEVAENDLLSDSNMDSFGYAMFWMNISQDYKIVKEKDSLSYQFMIQLSLNNVLKDYPYYVNTA